MHCVRFSQSLLFCATLFLVGCQVIPPTANTLPAQAPPPTKFAVAIPTSTFTPTPTRTATFTPTRTHTRTLTPTLAPTKTFTPSPIPPTKLPPTLAPSPTSVQPTTPPVLPDEKYGLLSPDSSNAPHLPANVDLNVRGFAATNAQAGMVDYAGQFDAAAPAMYRMFADNRTPAISATYQVYNWDNVCNCRGTLDDDWDVTAIGLVTNQGEVLSVPDSGYDIGDGYEVLVVYVDSNRIVFTYTREDSTFRGYVVYLDGIIVEPNLIALYQQADRAGRGTIPALRAGQSFARARGTEMKFAMRDAGAFMDSRSRKDWWRR